MGCFICDSANRLKTFTLSNNIELKICNFCFNKLLYKEIKCSSCNKRLNSDSSNHIEAKIGRNGIICSECEQRGVKVTSNLALFKKVVNNFKSYSYKPHVIFNHLPNETDSLYMGVELEIGGTPRQAIVTNFCNNHAGHIFYFKSDGSIRRFGCEIVSHPCTLAYHLSDNSGWRELFSDFNTDGFVSGLPTNTGLHIHVNKNILTQTQMKKVDLIVNQWSSLFEIIGRRRQNHYCRYVQKLHSQLGISSDRYQSVNFLNPNTVEFRFFCGTNDVNELFASLECVKAIVLMAKTISYDILYENEEEVLNIMKTIVKENNFVNFSNLMVKKTGDSSWKI